MDARIQDDLANLPPLLAVLGAVHVVLSLVCSLAGPFKTKPHVAAHQFISLFDHSVCGLCGVYFWVYQAGTIEDRAYGYHEGAVFLLKANFVFQVYDLVTSLLIKDFRKLEMLAHHALTTVLAWWCLTGPYLHYYSIFFIGVGEVSSIPLVAVDTFKHFPDVGKCYPTLDAVCKGIFAVVFVSVRCIYWPIVNVGFWKLTFHLLNTQTAHSKFVVISFFLASLFMTFLQEYWGYLVYRGVRKMISGSDKKIK